MIRLIIAYLTRRRGVERIFFDESPSIFVIMGSKAFV